MVRTFFCVTLALVAVVWMPWWFALLCIIVGIIFCRYSVVFLIPALLADIIYAPHTGTFFGNFLTNHKTLLLVAGLLVLWYVLLSTTRVRHLYDPKTN